ncbi:MAG: hypothetical protein AAB606_00205 [Patescibacteria group bacterium]
MELLTINEAALFSGKSIQTIRRMIKQKKVTVKRQKTPQGFNYLVIKDSLLESISRASQTPTQAEPIIQEDTREHRPITEATSPDLEQVFRREIGQFNTTIQKLVEQNQKDKEGFFQLIKTFQDRVVVLEDQIKQLGAPQASWWQFWK